jgi:hypothetical protein
MSLNGGIRNCGNCGYFEPVKGHPKRVGHCLADPPMAFAAMAPNPASVLSPGAPPMQPVVQSMERPVEPTRRACRHWSAQHG